MIQTNNSVTKATAGSKLGRRHQQAREGMKFERVFSVEGTHPFEQIEWELRTAEITDDGGKVIFRQQNVEVPKSWSILATKIAVSKYFYGDVSQGTDVAKGGRESSIRQLVHRVTRTIADWGLADGYFASPEDAEVFYEELTWLCVNQYGAFNSPVWFNVGLHHQYGIGANSGLGNYCIDRETKTAYRARTQYEKPQCSACFIQQVEDNMESIMELARSEAMLFKFGSGTGSDLSTIRSTREKLSGGGKPSGPLSFLKVYDQVANVVKSGGKTRRAAKMNTLKDWHPDIEEFIEAKTKEEKKAWALIEQGYDGSFNGDAYGSVMYQNENLSVRVGDEFMEAAVSDGEWWTRAVRDGQRLEQKSARGLLRKIAEGTWICGDPGMQFDSTIHQWHTCKGTDRQHSTNPCSEYLFLNDTACNLASLNLVKFKRADGGFDVARFKAAVRLFITAQEILVDNASYPTPAITVNSHIFRTLGLGYANLGSLIMSYGHSYDSNEGRGLAGAITAIMTGQAYEVSAELAANVGPFPGYLDARCHGIDQPLAKDNVQPMLDVIKLHREHVEKIDTSCPAYLRNEARQCWDEALTLGRQHGYRNAQVSVLAPTGTIGFLMDCDTTGIEPDIALVKYKLLAGGGMLKIVNQTVPQALTALGYTAKQSAAIIKYIDEKDTIEGAPELKPEHVAVFDCAFKPANGTRSLGYQAHIYMMAAAQPFLSGAISKTVNLPHNATAEDIMNTYIEGWRLGLKAIAIYRDGSKRSAPLNVKKTKDMGGASAEKPAVAADVTPRPVRRRMSDTRVSITHKFDIAGHEGYITVGLFDDKQPGEVFITMAKEGSTIGGLMDALGTMVSLSLQYGVPLEALVKKFAHTRYEPSGFTRNPDIPMAKSITDYIFRWLGCQFIEGYREANSPNANQRELPLQEVIEAEKKKINRPVKELALDDASPVAQVHQLTVRASTQTDELNIRFRDGITCPDCGSSKIKHTGTCATCLNCGSSLGCS
ncbi:MAG: vitamin B12-dependent ribonucleotide reductase [Verrucomicrobiales bacterium]|jgi:ribonucleoside-diphosphate reductase alpha chain|nr:vitamin B12-dependent ribonucleotide reductase [Verrucomicrobiales bacterium]